MHVLKASTPMFVLSARAVTFGSFSCWFYVVIPLLPKLSVSLV
ncbi:MAG: hypothetical protein SO161_08320 [Treponema sp.]|nr:hypothetical protein [Treponema sp.]